MMKEYLLDSLKAFSFFRENLSQVNELSNTILEILQLRPGTFHAFLPENMSSEKVHDFTAGGKTSSLRQEICLKLTNIINSNELFSCIFDDFNSDLDSVNNNDLYQFCGVHYKREIYYLIHFNSNQQLVSKCLNYSSTIWHSLCVIFIDNLSREDKKEIDRSYIQIICRNALFVMIEAYDSESYIFWQKNE